MDGLVKSTNGLYKPGEVGCYNLFLAGLVFKSIRSRIIFSSASHQLRFGR